MAYIGSTKPVDPSYSYAEQGIAVKEASAVSSAEGTMEQARDLSNRLQILADRICGLTPSPTLNQGAERTRQEPNGVFPALQINSELTNCALSEGFRALYRIEASLP